MEFQEIYTTPMYRAHKPAANYAALLVEVKKRINATYRRLIGELRGLDPTWLRETTTLHTVAAYNTGTVEVDGTTAVIGTDTVWTSAMTGRKFKLDGFAEVLIFTYVSGTTGTFDKVCNADADDELGYVIFDDQISLPSDCGEIVSIGQWRTPKQLDRIGIQELRRKQFTDPISVDPFKINDPNCYAFLDESTIEVYPAPSRVIRLELDYEKKITALSATDDEPILPEEWHVILQEDAYGWLLDYNDDIRAREYLNPDNGIVANMIRKLKVKTRGRTDRPKIKPKMKRTY